MNILRRHHPRYERRQRIFRSILVPLDGSPLAEHALPFALSIAERSGATVHIVLIHVPEAYYGYSAAEAQEWDLDAHAQQQAYLDSVKARLGSTRCAVEFHHLQGLVPETLTHEVAQRAIDLVVMNAHGWGYMSRALLGSVSDYLIRHLDIPILLMHTQGARAELTRAMAFHRILIPLDGSELAETILEPAQALGQLWQAEYHLLRVVATPRGTSAPASEEAQSQAAAYLEAVAARLRQSACNVQTHVVADRHPAAAIVQEATTAACDLIAISTHGRGGVSRLVLGSVTDKVIRSAHTPVLSYRPRDVGD